MSVLLNCDSTQIFRFQPLPVEGICPQAPVYWANDLFLRRAISTGGGYGRIRAHSCSPDFQTWLLVRSFIGGPPNPRLVLVKHGSQYLCDSTASASPGAALHLAHSSDRSRSDPDHAAARYAGGSQGVCAASRRLDRRASRPFAEGRTVSCRHSGSAARCAAPDRASRRRARHGVDRNPRQRREDSVRGRWRRAHGPSCPRLSQARSAQGPAQGLARLCARSRRQGQAGIDPRSVEPLGFVHLGRIAVVFLATDPRAALRAGLSRRP